MNEEELLKNLEIAAKKAGQLMLGASHIEDVVTQKGDFHNLVTEYDKKVQEYLFEKLSRLLPEAKFMGEEEDQDHFRKEYKEGWLFVIDPIDGTSNFIRRYRPSVTSIGLFLNGKPHIGIVYNPYHDLLYTACSGKGAYLNGRRLRGSDTPLRDSLVCMGTVPYYGEKTIRRAFDTAYWYMSRCIDIRRSGAAAWDLCQVAEGTCGVFFEPVLQLWDYAAGALIVTEAGGKVTDMDGNELSYEGPASMLAVTSGVSREEYIMPYAPLKESGA